MSATSIPSLAPPDPATYNENLSNSFKLIRKILSVEANSISHVIHQYEQSTWSIKQLVTSLKVMNDSLLNQNKLVVSGIGKSYKIAAKVVATFNSLSLHSLILHPSDALHGDLGLIRDGDVLILISASGGSSELVELLTHLDSNKIKILLLTCNPNSGLARHPKVSSLIYLDLPSEFKEENVYGLTLPTVSTSLLLALMDSVLILLSQLYINDLALRKKLFGERHPGGAIGLLYSNEESSSSHSSSMASISTSTTMSDDQEPLDLEFNKICFVDRDPELTSDVNTNVRLVQMIKDSSKKIKYLDQLPPNENCLFKVVMKSDVIILENQKLLLSEEIIQIIRTFDTVAEDLDNYYEELKWRVQALFKKIVL